MQIWLVYLWRDSYNSALLTLVCLYTVNQKRLISFCILKSQQPLGVNSGRKNQTKRYAVSITNMWWCLQLRIYRVQLRAFDTAHTDLSRHSWRRSAQHLTDLLTLSPLRDVRLSQWRAGVFVTAGSNLVVRSTVSHCRAVSISGLSCPGRPTWRPVADVAPASSCVAGTSRLFTVKAAQVQTKMSRTQIHKMFKITLSSLLWQNTWRDFSG